MLILGIESSCDETALSVSRDGREILSNCVLSQIDMHTIYGGVVPEIASRKHIEAITGLADEATNRLALPRLIWMPSPLPMHRVSSVRSWWV